LVIFLSGDLGAGKTTLARGILRGLGYGGRVKSPTYALVEVYTVSRLYLYHFDFYRLDDPRGWIDAGLREHFTANAVCLVEWPERRPAALPPADIAITLAVSNEYERDIAIVAHSPAGARCPQDSTPSYERCGIDSRDAVTWMAFALVIGLVLAALYPSFALSNTQITSTRLWPAKEYTRVTIEAAAALRYSLFTVTSPQRVVLDLEGSNLAPNGCIDQQSFG
jgi:tRNA threonylcarbamoyladenosine biosynthesis protein TsaE